MEWGKGEVNWKTLGGMEGDKGKEEERQGLVPTSGGKHYFIVFYFVVRKKHNKRFL